MTSPADLIRQGRLAEAETLFRQALAAAPDDAGTLTNLGVVLQLQARFDEAEACYRQALALRPDQPMTLNNLGVVLQARDAVEEAIGCFRRAVALRPDYQEALNGLGVALQAEGRLDEAIASFRQVLALRADHAETRLNLATALLVAGDLEAGFRELEWRWRARGRAEHLPEQLPPWSGEPLAGGTLMVLAEQGAGDTFQFIRYLGELKARSGAGRVLMLAAPPLARLLASAEGIDRLLVPGDEPEPFDRYVPLLSLPHHFGTRLDTIPAAVPYLSAPQALVDAHRRSLDGLPGRKVGLVWRGNPRHRNDRKRSLPENVWPDLGRLPGGSWVSLNPGPTEAETRLLADHLGAVDITSTLADWADTAAAIMALDLVVTVDTGVAHLAGALGRPAWVLLPFAPDWRWLLGRSDSPWYPSLRLFRQPRAGDWPAVIEAVRNALGEG